MHSLRRRLFGPLSVSPRNRLRKEHEGQPRRPKRRLSGLEILEDRTLLDAGAATTLTNLQHAAATFGSFGASLISGPLNIDLPIVGSALSSQSNTLGHQILGIDSIFNHIDTALGAFSVNNVNTAMDPVGELQNELGSGFTVSQVDGNQVLVKYTQAAGAPSLSIDKNLTDFFANSGTNYLSDISSLSGTGTGSFAPGSQFTMTFGANNGGFFVKGGDLFSSSSFTASLSLSGTVKVGAMIFGVSLSSATASMTLNTLDLKLGLCRPA